LLLFWITELEILFNIILKKFFPDTYRFFSCPHAGRAFPFLLDEKRKQKNQEEMTLQPALGNAKKKLQKQ